MVESAHQMTEYFGPEGRAVTLGDIIHLAKDRPMKLESGVEIQNFPIAYRTYGALNASKDNAVLVCHGLTADQYVAEDHPVTGKAGWWHFLIGPGKAIDTDRFFVICSNTLGSCMGSYGPKAEDPKTGKPFALKFPVVTIGDMVQAQKLLLEALGIEQLACVVGGSMGGMQALQWLAKYPESVRSVMPIATSARLTAQNIAFNEIGRQAIMVDPDWRGGEYLQAGTFPTRGLAVARMAAHVTYLSEHGMHDKFGRGLQEKKQVSYGFDADFQIESYLRYQGKSFVERFDPNAYFYITRAMDYFDLATLGDGKLSLAFERSKDIRCLVLSFSTDWLFPTAEAMEIVRALSAIGAPVSFTEIVSDRGHDAFLLEIPEFIQAVKGFFDSL
jgi:homoserine O-acetyltransferase